LQSFHDRVVYGTEGCKIDDHGYFRLLLKSFFHGLVNWNEDFTSSPIELWFEINKR
jgi:hypothetical protein